MMCDVCLTVPCLTQCPNAVESKPVFTFFACNEPIYSGDEHLEVAINEILCGNCVEDMTKAELVEYLGYELKEA